MELGFTFSSQSFLTGVLAGSAISKDMIGEFRNWLGEKFSIFTGVTGRGVETTMWWAAACPLAVAMDGGPYDEEELDVDV